eukprot:14140234-Ditylum_brightwellii.AAC.1
MFHWRKLQINRPHRRYAMISTTSPASPCPSQALIFNKHYCPSSCQTLALHFLPLCDTTQNSISALSTSLSIFAAIYVCLFIAKQSIVDAVKPSLTCLGTTTFNAPNTAKSGFITGYGTCTFNVSAQLTTYQDSQQSLVTSL